jgi:RNA polymerase sigma-70 factor (ECF subfamily)
MSDDLQLLRAWRSGDEAAGNRLVRRHFVTVFCFFSSKVQELATDLTQQTFLACVEGRDRLREDTSFRAYLLAIARNLLYSYFRKKGRRDKVEQLGEVSIQDLAGSPSRVIALREEQRLVLLALRHIPVDLQIALELFYWEDMTMVEIGVVLGIPEGTVKSRLHRARRLLRQGMEDLAESADLLDTTADNLERWARSLRAALQPEPGDDATG